MLLSEFLGYFDFDYEVVNGQVRLIDLQGAYLGDIDKDRFALSECGKIALVDRLDTYINDYIIEDLEERLVRAGVDGVSDMMLADMAKIAREKDLACEFSVVDAIVNPASIEFENEKIVESFSAGQIYYEKDTDKYIVLKNTCNDDKDIWNLGVYNKDMQYLYDTTVYDKRLANDVIAGCVKSQTDWKTLRLEPQGFKTVNENAGTITASLELNDFLMGRFDDVFSVQRREVESAFVKLGFKDDTVSFSLIVFDADPKEGIYRRKEIEVCGTSDDKVMLLPELEYLEPDFFNKWGKQSLDTNISNAEKQKNFCTPGFNFKIDKEEGIDR